MDTVKRIYTVFTKDILLNPVLLMDVVHEKGSKNMYRIIGVNCRWRKSKQIKVSL